MIGRKFAAGRVFFRSGDAADLAYRLHDGQVELLAEESGTSRRVRMYHLGEVFGEMALLEERPRTFTTRAVTGGRTTALSRGEFEYQLIHDPIQTQQYLRSLFERFALRRAITVAVLRLSKQIPLRCQSELGNSISPCWSNCPVVSARHPT